MNHESEYTFTYRVANNIYHVTRVNFVSSNPPSYKPNKLMTGYCSLISERLIAYCGLYCGDCNGFSGKIPDLGSDLRKELRASR